jgi:hypothetical protein
MFRKRTSKVKNTWKQLVAPDKPEEDVEGK